MRGALVTAAGIALAAPALAAAAAGTAEGADESFFYDTRAGNVLAALIFGLVVFLATVFWTRAHHIHRIRSRLEPHVPSAAEEPDTSVRERLGFLQGLFAATERVFGRLKLWQKMSVLLVRADSSLRPAEFFYVMLGCGLALAIFLALLGAPAALIVLGFVLGLIPPPIVMAVKAGKREEAFDEQLADLLLTMGGSLRAGHTFRQAMQAIVDEGDEPASKEFKRVLVEVGIGRNLDDALEDMASRMRSSNFEYVISVVSIQREVGGNLAALFDMVSETVRQRQQFSKKVRALTATGRISAYILAVMPFFVAAVLSLVSPGYITPLFTEAAGRVLLVVALASIGIGALILKKMVSFRMS